MGDRDFVTTAETQAIDRDVRSSIEAAVAAVDQPRRRVRDVRSDLRALRPDDEPSTILRQFPYGFVRVDTDVVFREVDSKGRLHLVVAVAGDEIDEVMFWEIDGTLVEFSSQADFNSGSVDLGRFKNVARLRERLGVPGQQAIPDLVNETSVTSSFVGAGIAYLYGRFNAKPGIFSGDPTIRAIVRGRKAIDPRDGVQKWTINPIVHAYDLLVKSKRLGGAERQSDEIDLSAWQTGADFGEELVATKEFTRTTRATQFANNQLLFPDFPVLDFQFGDVVQVFANPGETLPAALSEGVDYHCVPRRHRIGDVGEIGFPSLRLAATFENAMLEDEILFGLVTSDFQVKKVRETRYSCAFSYRGRFTRTLLEDVLATCGARLTNKSGKISLVLQKFPDTVKSVTAGDIEGNISLSNKLPREQRTTSLIGKFISPANLFQSDDYPLIGGEAFEDIDKGDFSRTFDLDYVPKVSTAQRQARFEFNERRQEKTLAFAAKMQRYDVQAGDVFALDYARLGLDANTTFKCTSRRTFVEISDGIPKFRLDYTARQLEAETYDEDLSAEELVLAAKLPNIEDPRTVQPPGEPQISERQFETIEGAGVRVGVTMAWETSGDPFFKIYQPQYKLSSDTDFIDLPRTTNLSREILDLAPGTYDFQVITINNLNLESGPALTGGVEIKGLSAAPVAITNFEGQMGSETVLLTWDRHPDLDVRIGGKIEIRHHCDVAGGNSSNSLLLAGGSVNGDATFANVSALVGTYYIRAIDQLGIAGPFIEWSTDNVRPVPFAQIISGGVFDPNDSNQGLVTIAEGPGWLSTNPANTVEFDRTNNVIKLRPKDRISGEALFSAIPLVSAVGSLGDVEAEGVYHFFTRLELDAVTRMRIEVELDTTILNTEDVFSQRPGLVSDFVSFSGIIDPSVATAFMQARFTQDDPNASPVWSPWERIETRNFIHRAIEFRVQLRSFEASYNIQVNQAAVRARELGAAA